MKASWTKISASQIDVSYRDVPLKTPRDYSDGGEFHEADGVVALQPIASVLWFIGIFGVGFTILFSVVAFVFIPDQQKWLFGIGGPIVGCVTFSLIYYLVKQNVDAGPYISFDIKKNAIELNRYGAVIELPDVCYLQWISGRTKDDPDFAVDLNLVVQNRDGQLMRYFVLGSPQRKLVRQFAERCQVPVVEVAMGWRGRRDVDVDSVDR